MDGKGAAFWAMFFLPLFRQEIW